MAVKLNKTRIRDSKIILISTIIVSAISASLFPDETSMHDLFDQLGYLLVSICVVGRVYSTAFLGGFKNDMLITSGPFSVVRNPLYTFSLIGVLGIGLMSSHITAMIFLPVAFLLMYHSLIKREEEFLTETFGEEYIAYCKRTPRLIPNFKLYHAPDTVPMTPKYLNKALRDSCFWLAIFPIIELFEQLQDLGYLKPLFFLP
jgi:protein-S-isoprenylcysteine O-methyltransferase Ste14